MDENRAKSLKVTLLAITPDAQKIIEIAGRTCWKSFEKISDDSQAGFIRKLIGMGHDSPLEHATATFRIENCSRAMSHQFVRHRLISVCQQSQRHVEQADFNYIVPESMPPEFEADFHKDMETIGRMYEKWRQRGLKKEDARFVLPNACATEFVVSANFREWRHILKIRLTKKTQWEFRNACRQIHSILLSQARPCFEDISESAE
jgi:thymidylate synthase (FAD)